MSSSDEDLGMESWTFVDRDTGSRLDVSQMCHDEYSPCAHTVVKKGLKIWLWEFTDIIRWLHKHNLPLTKHFRKVRRKYKDVLKTKSYGVPP